VSEEEEKKFRITRKHASLYPISRRGLFFSTLNIFSAFSGLSGTFSKKRRFVFDFGKEKDFFYLIFT
jgi:hypothetical protein